MACTYYPVLLGGNMTEGLLYREEKVMERLNDKLSITLDCTTDQA
jgi:hypothetical protein